MPKYKNVKKSLPLIAEKLLFAAFDSVLKTTQKMHSGAQKNQIKATPSAPSELTNLPERFAPSPLRKIPGCAVGAFSAKHEQQARTQAIAAQAPGAKLVYGWCLEDMRRNGINKFVVIMDHHVVIEFPDGQMLCPNTPVGEEIGFVRDDFSGPDDLPMGSKWNRCVFANVAVKGSLGTASPFALTWATTWGHDMAYSDKACHAKWLSWAQGDPIKTMALLGLTCTKPIDFAMTCDFDEVTRALKVFPAVSQIAPDALGVLAGEMQKLQANGVFQAKNKEVEVAENSALAASLETAE